MLCCGVVGATYSSGRELNECLAVAGRLRGSGVHGEANEGVRTVRCMGGISQKKIERLSSEVDMMRIVFMGNNLMYYTTSREFIDIPGIIVL